MQLLRDLSSFFFSRSINQIEYLLITRLPRSAHAATMVVFLKQPETMISVGQSIQLHETFLLDEPYETCTDTTH
jgi:hypothetical protein